jgi:hypothetical protein
MEFKEFCFKINITTPDQILGESEDNILNFEEKYSIKLPDGFRSVLKYTGKKLLFYNGETILDINNTIANISKSIDLNNEKKIIDKVHLIDGSLTNLLPIDYYVEGDAMSFIKLNEENPDIYVCFGNSSTDDMDEDDLYIESTWINRLRRIILVELQHKFYYTVYPKRNADSQKYEDQSYLITKCLNIDGISWAKEYINFYEKDKGLLWLGSRERFENIAAEIENREDRILGIDEFEWMFIDYLKERGKL